MTAPASQVVIEPNIDRYGKYARSSALADYLELAALAGKRITRDRLEDLIEENEWARRPKRQYYTPNQEPDPAAWSDSVFSVVADRRAALVDRYPFEERGRAVRVVDAALDRGASEYLAVLAITVVHAWGLPAPVDPEEVLEELVAGVLENLGLAVSRMGTLDREAGGFRETLKAGGTALGLRPSPDPRPVSRRAKDAGVDTLGGVVWRDGRRAGQWLFLGQATVAQSHEWERKLSEPQPPRWARYLQEPLLPQAFLAVPHHVEDDHMDDLLLPEGASRRPAQTCVSQASQLRRRATAHRSDAVCQRPPCSGVRQ